MKVLITGICGFVGSSLAFELKRSLEGMEISGLDNLSRPGSEQNRQALKKCEVRFIHGDIRTPSDLEVLPKVDWVIDAAANPSVLAGVAGSTSARQLLEHNLSGTMHVLEYCKRVGAGLLMLSTSRVYSLTQLCALPMDVRDAAFVPRFTDIQQPGVSARGVAEDYPTQAPISLYGSAKLASEIIALEYGAAFDFPVHVNRCGVLTGAGQFGKPDQGIFAFWIHSYCHKRPLKYIGFAGTGHQTRDCLHPKDLASLVTGQMKRADKSGQILNVGGGMTNSISLRQLSGWCAERFGKHEVASDPAPRRYDVPWLVLDSARAEAEWKWRPATKLEKILEEIASHAEQHPEWLEMSSDS